MGLFGDVVGDARGGVQKGLSCRMDEVSAVYIEGSDEVVNLVRGK